MNWLRKIWDEYNWILFLPFVLLIGILIILVIIGIRYGVIFVFNAVPFSVWGSLLGGSIIFLAGWYLKNKISESKLGFSWNLVTQISPFGIGLGILGLIILTAAIIFIFQPNSIISAWDLFQKIGFGLFALTFLYAYICAAGSFIGDGILAFRFDTLWGGMILTLIGITGLCPIIMVFGENLIKSFGRQFWLGALANGAVLMLISWFILSYFIIHAFNFQPSENKKDELN